MTNQVNQAFEKWAINQKDEHNLPYFTVKLANGKYADALTTHAWNGYQASTQASEQRIKELEEIFANEQGVPFSVVKSEITELKEIVALLRLQSNIDARRIEELSASNNQLREALEACKYDCHTGEVILIAEKALSSTTAQSLSERKEQYEDKLMEQFTDPNL